MARLDIRPVTCQVTGSDWSQVLILSESPELGAVPNTPTWVISLSLKGINVATKGPEYLEIISNSYRQIELKTPESLYHLLEDTLRDQLNASVAAASLSTHQMTLFGLGSYAIHVRRGGACGCVLSGDNEQTWKVVEGTWQEGDRWSLAAGDTIQNTVENMLNIDQLEQAAETLHGEIATAAITSLANALIHINPSERVPSIELTTPKKIKKQHVMIVGWALLALLIISIWFGSKARTEQLHAVNFTKLETTINTGIAVAQTTKTTDQSLARQQMRELQTTLSQNKKQFETDKKWLTKWVQLNTKAETAYQELAGETAIANLPEWFSLSIINQNLVGDKLILAGENLLVLDKTNSSLAKIGINSKKGESMGSGGVFANVKAIAGTATKAFSLTDTGIIETIISKKTSTTLVEKDTEWLSPELLTTFNGNIYLLDTGASAIWRYSATATGLGSKQAWLGAGVTLPLGQINSLAVDSDVWLLKSGGIARFRRGAPLSFTISGLDTPLSQNTPAFSVSLDQDRIAILDAGNQRIVLMTKQGVYLKQIQWSGLTGAKDIALSIDAASVYVLANGFIYSANW